MVINPKGVASWLVDNTILTFDQIAEFCEIHRMEVQAIADGDVKIASVNPITDNQLTRDEIGRGEKNENYKLKQTSIMADLTKKTKYRYKSVSKRNLIPCCVLYIITKYPNAKSTKIASICGSTKSTVDRIRDGSYKFMGSLDPKNPVLAGLCTQRDLDGLNRDFD